MFLLVCVCVCVRESHKSKTRVLRRVERNGWNVVVEKQERGATTGAPTAATECSLCSRRDDKIGSCGRHH